MRELRDCAGVSRRSFLREGSAAVLVLSAWSVAAKAAEWPTRRITIIVPYSAGGIADLIARLCGRVLSGKFGQPFVVDDRPGANGVLATTAVAKAAADGYTLLLSTPGQMVTEPLLQKVAYDPDQFASISIVASFPLLLAIKSSLPAKTVSEFIAYAKANPGKLNYASGGIGAVTHLVTALFASRAGLEIVHVPYKGSAPATAALISGEVDLFFGTSSEIIPQLLSGRIRVLATSGAKRFSLLPDVPTISETFPGFKLDPWNGLLATPGTPRDIVGRIAEALISATKTPLMAEQLAKLGVFPEGTTPEQFANVISDDKAFYKAAIKAAGVGPT